MMIEHLFTNEEGEEATTVYSVVVDEANWFGMKYGIKAITAVNGKTTDECTVRQRFFTYEEAERMAEGMCRHNVSPCTVADILMDLNEKY